MNRVPLIKTLTLLVVGTLVVPAVAFAEVSVEVDPSTGEYIGYHIRTNQSGSNPRVWESPRAKKGIHALNRLGDDQGDGFPLIAENMTGNTYPWVVWERTLDGAPRSLAWSRWTGAAWSPMAGLCGGGGGTQSLPVLQFNSAGRAYLAFVEQTPTGQHQVRFTLFLVTTWAASIVVSGEFEDALSPSLRLLDDQMVELTYSMPDGHTKTVTVRFANPGTITDDVYPFLTDSAEVLEGTLY